MIQIALLTLLKSLKMSIKYIYSYLYLCNF